MSGSGSGVEIRTLCAGCGCLCDDARVDPGSGAVRFGVGEGEECAAGAAWFGDRRADADGDGGVASAWIGGEAVSAGAAIAAIGARLRGARRALVVGLGPWSVETQRRAVELADRAGATLAADGSSDSPRKAAVFARLGRVSATFGEWKSRADLMIYWRANPWKTHPRHASRFLPPNPRRLAASRAALVADGPAEATETAVGLGAETAAEYWPLGPLASDGRGDAFAVWMLRAAVRGAGVDGARARRGLGEKGAAVLEAWAARIRASRYGVLALGPGVDSETLDAATRLTRDLNFRADAPEARFAMGSLGGAGNRSGADAVTTWQAGSPGPIDFSGGFPRLAWRDGVPRRAIARGECDLVVALDDEPIAGEGEGEGGSPPLIRISPRAGPGPGVAVAIRVSPDGARGGGTCTFVRADGVFLPTRALGGVFDDPGLATAGEVLDGVLEAIADRPGPESDGALHDA